MKTSVLIFQISLSLLLFVFIGCETFVETNTIQYSNQIFEKDGLVDSLGGDCSGVQIRTSELDTIDFTNYNSVKFNFNAGTDTDISSFEIFYIESDIKKNLVYLEGNSINSINQVIINSPKVKTNIYSRVTLQSSICTGQIYYIKLRDIKIFVD